MAIRRIDEQLAKPRPSSFDPRATLDKIMKPLEAYQQRRDQALAALRAPPEEQETRFCWGGPGQFALTDVPPAVGVSFKSKDKDKDEPAKEDKVLKWEQTGGEYKKIRVENPDDPEQYVIVLRWELLYFRPPGEEIKEWPKHPHSFKMKWPEQKKKK